MMFWFTPGLWLSLKVGSRDCGEGLSESSDCILSLVRFLRHIVSVEHIFINPKKIDKLPSGSNLSLLGRSVAFWF